MTNHVFSVLMHEVAAAISNAELDAAYVPSFHLDVNRYVRLIAWFVRFDYVRQLQVSCGHPSLLPHAANRRPCVSWRTLRMCGWSTPSCTRCRGAWSTRPSRWSTSRLC